MRASFAASIAIAALVVIFWRLGWFSSAASTQSLHVRVRPAQHLARHAVRNQRSSTVNGSAASRPPERWLIADRSGLTERSQAAAAAVSGSLRAMATAGAKSSPPMSAVARPLPPPRPRSGPKAPKQESEPEPELSDGGGSTASVVETSSNTSVAAVWGTAPWQQELWAQARQLRFYVYEPPEEHDWAAVSLTQRYPRCKTFQWSGDWDLSQTFARSAQRTADGDAADFFIVPFLSKCYYNFAAKYKLKAMDRVMGKVLKFLRSLPWWETRKARHVFFFMSGIGAGIVPSWQRLLGPSVFVVAEGDRQAAYFRYGHDVVVPGKLSVRPLRRQAAAPGRRLLAVFRGSLDATLRDADGARVHERNQLRRWLDQLLRPEPRVVYSGHKSDEYVREMDSSRFCLIPRGNTPWTRRFFDAAVRGCIPVVLSDPVSFPYERLLDYTRMTLKLPEQWAPRLAAELRAGVNRSAMARLQRALLRAWPAFVYDGGCAFDFLLLELAARKHGYFDARAPATPNDATHFWSPGRGAFELASARKVGPSWGAGAVPH